MLSGSEEYYDDIYRANGKDYAVEAGKIHEFVQKHKQTDGNSLLDIACGTGSHANSLREYYQVRGIDINADMLKIARKKHPEIRFTRGDMRSFKLSHRFDIITCLFSAIGYMKTRDDLRKAVRNMSQHLLPGGVLLVEPWYTPEHWPGGGIFSTSVENPDMKIVRMSHGGTRGKKVSRLTFHYLIGTTKGIRHILEHHDMGLFTHDEYMNAFSRAGLVVTHDTEGVDGRGLYIGTKPS